MSLRIIIFLSLLFFCGAKASIVSDQLVFRVQKRTMFLSDVGHLLKNMSDYRCLFPGSLLLRAVGIKQIDLKLKLNEKNLKDNQVLISKLVKFLKIQKFVETQNVNVSSVFLGKQDLRKCNLKSWKSLNHDLREMIMVEFFFQKRFGARSLSDFLSTLYKKIKHDLFF